MHLAFEPLAIFDLFKGGPFTKEYFLNELLSIWADSEIFLTIDHSLYQIEPEFTNMRRL